MWVLGQHVTTNRTKHGTIVGMAKKDKKKQQQQQRQQTIEKEQDKHQYKNNKLQCK